MDNPRFIDQLNSGSPHPSPGDAFQIFVHELLLHDYPDLHVFPGGGKDGGIDLVQTTAQPRLVVECKYIGNDDLSEAQQRWRSVKKNLEKHLADPAGPTKGQAQYRPWYNAAPAINEYIFCVSSRLAGVEQFAVLRGEIEQFFVKLASTHQHLQHLSDLKVTVLDWNDLHDRLRRHPHVMFRWFPQSRPRGLVPLDEIKTRTRSTFRSYLFGDKLEYYGRNRHLRRSPAPPAVNIPDEAALLNQLEGDNITGLIVTGSGGIGKTRLTLELGYLARRQNWTVLRVLERLKEDTLQLLVAKIQPDAPVLLLIDYVETQRDFEELIESLNALNDTYNLRLRYVANCRTSYYRTIAQLSRHHQVDLSPVAHEAELSEWLLSYQQSAVRHILEQSGLAITDSILKVCHDLPVLAVFVSYLYSTGRKPELDELLKEEDFANWVYKRVKLSFGAASNPRDLALFISLFPLSAAVASHAELGQYGGLLDTLAADGWIEKLPADELHESERWEVAHDVLADQIVLSYFKTIPRTIARYVHELFSLARRVGSLRSAFIAVQRLVDHPLVKSVDWPKLLGEELREDPGDWRGIRDLLLRTPLLTYEQIIELLGEQRDVWEGAETDWDFQNALGWFARLLQGQEKETGAEHRHRPLLTSWIRKAAPHASTSNFVLTRGLQFCPEAVRDAALNWITTKPRLFQTQYLMVAWLDTGLPPDAIGNFVEQWAINFSTQYQLSFIIRSWLDAGGDKELVQSGIEAWLVEHQTTAVAGFIYRTWLDAGGDKELVQSDIEAWLVKHQTTVEADYVYRAWLDAGGDKELVQSGIEAWLVEHQTTAEAGYVYRAWLDAGGDKELVQGDIEAWLVKHLTTVEAGYVYRGWLNAGGDKELVQSGIEAWLVEHQTTAEAGYVYHAWLDAGGNRQLIRESLEAWLREHGKVANADFIFKAWLENGGDFSLIRPFAIEWLSRNYDKAQAVYITKFIARQADIPVGTIRDILNWCRMFATDEDALWRLLHLRQHFSNSEVAEELCSTVEVVFQHRFLNNEPPGREAKNLITSLLSFFISEPNFRAGPLRGRIDVLLLAWVRHPASYGAYPPRFNIQRAEHVRRVAFLIRSGALSVSDERASLERFFRWVNAWELENKEKIIQTLADLKRRFPASDLWDIVKFK
jgi:peptidyl-tRNA hydrolase